MTKLKKLLVSAASVAMLSSFVMVGTPTKALAHDWDDHWRAERFEHRSQNWVNRHFEDNDDWRPARSYRYRYNYYPTYRYYRPYQTYYYPAYRYHRDCD